MLLGREQVYNNFRVHLVWRSKEILHRP